MTEHQELDKIIAYVLDLFCPEYPDGVLALSKLPQATEKLRALTRNYLTQWRQCMTTLHSDYLAVDGATKIDTALAKVIALTARQLNSDAWSLQSLLQSRQVVDLVQCYIDELLDAFHHYQLINDHLARLNEETIALKTAEIVKSDIGDVDLVEQKSFFETPPSAQLRESALELKKLQMAEALSDLPSRSVAPSMIKASIGPMPSLMPVVLESTQSQSAATVQRPAPGSEKIKFQLPNGQVGVAYDGSLQISGSHAEKVVVKQIRMPQDLGLEVAADQIGIQGTPRLSGEFSIDILYYFRGDEAFDLNGQLTLYVNPDARSLWKNIASDASDQFYRPESKAETLLANHEALLVGASIRGRSHAQVGAFRDDDFCMTTANGWDILAVADGAGSAQYSRRGAEIAVKAAVKQLAETVSGSDVAEMLAEAKSCKDNLSNQSIIKIGLYKVFGEIALATVGKIEAQAAAINAKPRDFSTTLLIAARKKLPSGEHFIASYWVGDGAIGLYRQGADIQLLGKVDSGEFAGQTRFLDRYVVGDGREIMSRIHFSIVDDFTALILMTDGVSDAKFETDHNLSRLSKWDDFWHEIAPCLPNEKRQPNELLKWLEFWSVGNHDDRTVAILYTP